MELRLMPASKGRVMWHHDPGQHRLQHMSTITLSSFLNLVFIAKQTICVDKGYAAYIKRIANRTLLILEFWREIKSNRCAIKIRADGAFRAKAEADEKTTILLTTSASSLSLVAPFIWLKTKLGLLFLFQTASTSSRSTMTNDTTSIQYIALCSNMGAWIGIMHCKSAEPF